MRISDWSSDVCSSDLLVDDVKAYDPNNSPLALPSTCIDHQAQLAAQKPLLYLATDIVYATDGAEAVLPSEMSVEVEATIPADQHAEIVTNTISERTGWLVESLKIEQRDRKSTRLNSSH